MSHASRLPRVIAVAALAAALLPASALLPTAVLAHSQQSGEHAQVGRIFVIMLENHSRDTVIGDPNAPYITSLAQTYAQATDYYGVTHPSQPNYVAAITGRLDITKMNDHPTNTYDWTNLVDQLESHGMTWGAYMEALPSVGYTDHQWPSNTALYTNKHDPFVLMTDILSNPDRLSHIKPYTDLAADLAAPNAPDFVWISPDQCNDMHGGVYATVAGHPETPCPYNSTVDDKYDVALKQKADAFVKGAVETIMGSPAWTGNSAIFVLSDESDFDGAATTTDLWADVSGCCDSPGYGIAPGLPDGYVLIDNGSHPWSGPFGGGKVPAIVISRHRSQPVTDARAYNHYSFLRTVEQMWHLGFLGYAADSVNVKSMMSMLQH